MGLRIVVANDDWKRDEIIEQNGGIIVVNHAVGSFALAATASNWRHDRTDSQGNLM